MPGLKQLRQAIQRPGAATRAAISLLRGHAYQLWYRCIGIRFSAGRNFRVYGSLKVRGPGRVVFGNNVSIGMEVTPYTHAPDALIEIGDDSYLNGTRFGCQQLIRVGPRAILADARILDTDFHPLDPERRHDPGGPVRTAPIILEENVWVGAAAGVLPGTRIGRNSVVGFGSVCSGDYPANAIIAGNPARVVRELRESERTPPSLDHELEAPSLGKSEAAR
jgi:acetyltransferase-like isoleucine patch superfamily enzyme